jgi:hypothetical protein
VPALADHKEHAWLCASGHDYAEATTHYFRQDRTSVSRCRPARGTDIGSRAARAPGQEPQSTRRGNSARTHSGRSWTFRNRHKDPAALRDGPSRPAGTACSGPASSGDRRYDARRPVAAASRQADTVPSLPRLAAAAPGPMTEARLTHPRSSSPEHDGLPGSRRCHRHALVLPGLPAACRHQCL